VGYARVIEWLKATPQFLKMGYNVGSNPSFSATFMTNCELVVEKYGS
jgi:hypothetical protein